MSSLFKMNSNRVFCLACPYIAPVLTDLGLKASAGFPCVRQTTGTFQHVNNIGGHEGNQAFDLKPLSCAGVDKLVAFILENVLCTLDTFVITIRNLVQESFLFLRWIIRVDHKVSHVWGSFKDHTWGIFKDQFYLWVSINNVPVLPDNVLKCLPQWGILGEA